jgi:hypothetical protein
MKPEIQMSMIPSSAVRSDDIALDRAEQGRAEPSRVEPTSQTDTSQRTSAWTAKKWLKLGAGVAAGVGVVAAGSAGITYALVKPSGSMLPTPSATSGFAAVPAKAPLPPAAFTVRPPAPVRPAGASGCIAPTLPRDAIFPVGPDPFYPAAQGQKQLFTAGRPLVGDVGTAAVNQFMLAGGYYPLLESLVALQPDFVASNVRADGTDSAGGQLYSVRLFNRPEAFGTPTEGWLQSGLADFSSAGAAWPRVYDHAISRASAAGIGGQHAQGAGDLDDYLSGFRDSAALLTGSPIQSLPMNAARATRTSGLALFEDKDDNIPYAVAMMQVNPLLFGMLTFDFNQDRPAGNMTLPSNTTLQSNALGLGVEAPGHPFWQIEGLSGGWVSYSITGMNADGVNLRLAGDPASAPDKFLAYDAMASAGDVLTLGRVYCGENPLTVA